MTLKKDFLKPSLSIESISLKRFLWGIVLGLLLSFLIYIFITLVRDAYRTVLLPERLLILDSGTLFQINYIIASASLVFGFHFTLQYWISNSNKIFSKIRIRKKWSKTYSTFVSYPTLEWLIKIGLVLLVLFNEDIAYQIEMGFVENLKYLFFLIILNLFFSQWLIVSYIYKSGKWIIVSLSTILFLSFLYANINIVDNDALTNIFKFENSYAENYINKEIKRASELGVEFDSLTKISLPYRRSYITKKLKLDVMDSFQNTNVVPELKYLVLHKIFIHNFCYDYMFYSSNLHEINNILKRCSISDNSKEIAILFEILNEYSLILNHRVDFEEEEFDNMSPGEAQRYTMIFKITGRKPNIIRKSSETRELDKKDGYVVEEAIELDNSDFHSDSDSARKVFNVLIKNLLSDPKYESFSHIIENKEKILDLVK